VREKGRRSYGTGSLHEYRGCWYGKWRIGDRQIKRKIGAKRKPGTRQGLTRKQAEARLRRLIDQVRVAPVEEVLRLADAGDCYLQHVEHVLERKPSTVQDYRIMLRSHLAPFFGAKAIDRITPDEVTSYMAAKRHQGLSTKTVSNHLAFLHGVFQFAVKRRWASSNPVAAADRPRSINRDPDIRYLDRSELEAVLRKVPDDTLGSVDRVLYLAAAVTGMRQGELIALRWQDVDWTAGVIRVRRNRTRGRWGTPKSRRSSRAIPMLDRLAGELDRHYKQSNYTSDVDLVFCHPLTGGPYDASKLRARFKGAVDAAGLRPIRFHDLRHTYGTHLAASGAPLRAIQEWMGHTSASTTEIYADYLANTEGRAWVERAFGAGTNSGTNLSTTEDDSDQVKPHQNAE
jgi:integrase